MLSSITLLFSSTMLTISSIKIVGAPTFSVFARGKKNSGPPRKDGPYKRKRNPGAQSGMTVPQEKAPAFILVFPCFLNFELSTFDFELPQRRDHCRFRNAGATRLPLFERLHL
jgi:hypothetical protein